VFINIWEDPAASIFRVIYMQHDVTKNVDKPVSAIFEVEAAFEFFAYYWHGN
jgi:hypothetical protein